MKARYIFGISVIVYGLTVTAIYLMWSAPYDGRSFYVCLNTSREECVDYLRWSDEGVWVEHISHWRDVHESNSRTTD